MPTCSSRWSPADTSTAPSSSLQTKHSANGALPRGFTLGGGAELRRRTYEGNWVSLHPRRRAARGPGSDPECLCVQPRIHPLRFQPPNSRWSTKNANQRRNCMITAVPAPNSVSCASSRASHQRRYGVHGRDEPVPDAIPAMLAFSPGPSIGRALAPSRTGALSPRRYASST